MNTDSGKLDRIADTIERLRAQMELHGDHIGGHETRTRVILIDPLLRSLGWDTEDPELVVHERRVGNLKLDYALVDQGQVVGILEAKSLGSRLNDAAWGKYVAELPSVPLVAFTNGDEWRFFRKSNKWQSETIRVSSGESFRTGFDFDRIIGGGAIKNQLSEPFTDAEATTRRVQSHVGVQVENERDTLTPLPDAEWGRKLARLRFNDGPDIAVRSWSGLLLEVSRFVVDRALVKPSDYPVVLAQAKQVKKCVLNTSPMHPHGKRFADPKEVREGIWLDNNLGSNKTRWQYSIRMLERFGVDPMTVRVEFA